MKEVDALDGVCGLASDQSGIQYKMLNRRKGPAVRGPRAQIDRTLYKNFVQKYLLAMPDLTIETGSVEDLIVVDDTDAGCKRVNGIVMRNGCKIKAPTVVITTGTFLRGQINIGLEVRPAGRIGNKPLFVLLQIIFDKSAKHLAQIWKKPFFCSDFLVQGGTFDLKPSYKFMFYIAK